MFRSFSSSAAVTCTKANRVTKIMGCISQSITVSRSMTQMALPLALSNSTLFNLVSLWVTRSGISPAAGRISPEEVTVFFSFFDKADLCFRFFCSSHYIFLYRPVRILHNDQLCYENPVSSHEAFPPGNRIRGTGNYRRHNHFFFIASGVSALSKLRESVINGSYSIRHHFSLSDRLLLLW